MTLTTRLSLFFLTTLAVVLAGFSGTLYVLARMYLERQTEARLLSTADTLAAAAEVAPDGVEWEPQERPQAFTLAAAGGPSAWLVRDDHGRVIEQAPPGSENLITQVPWQPRADGTERLTWHGEPWLVEQRTLVGTGVGSPAAEHKRYPSLTITVAIPTGPMHATLRWLAATLAGVSGVVWLLALALGRAVCRRAVTPIRRMAGAARAMDAATLGERLPVTATGDELEDLNRAFNGLLDRLQESFERQRRFAGDASHQLRTPLTALLGHVEVALRRERGTDEYRRVLQGVHQEASHLRRIVEALLFLTRADKEARPVGLETIHLDGWLEDHLASWNHHPRAGDLVVEHAGAASLSVQAHPVLLGELLNILLENACKYSPAGTPIRVRTADEDGSVLLAVEDKGYGIRPAEIAHLGEPFFRSPDARQRGVPGTGLGLSIARRLVNAFGGELKVTSRVGRGSQFTLVFPAGADRPSAAEARAGSTT